MSYQTNRTDFFSPGARALYHKKKLSAHSTRTVQTQSGPKRIPAFISWPLFGPPKRPIREASISLLPWF